MITSIIRWLTRQKNATNYTNYADPHQYSMSGVINRRVDATTEYRRLRLTRGEAQ